MLHETKCEVKSLLLYLDCLVKQSKLAHLVKFISYISQLFTIDQFSIQNLLKHVKYRSNLIKKSMNTYLNEYHHLNYT